MTIKSLLVCRYFFMLESFHFIEETCKQDLKLYVASVDVDSLFTNILLDKNIENCIDSFYNDNENTPTVLFYNQIVFYV